MTTVMASLPQATQEILVITHGHAFDDPRQFLSMVVDLMDGDSLVVTVLYNNCDRQLLEKFARFLESREIGTLQIAEKNALRYLCEARGVERSIAYEIAHGIATGAAAYANVPYEDPNRMLQSDIGRARRDTTILDDEQDSFHVVPKVQPNVLPTPTPAPRKPHAVPIIVSVVGVTVLAIAAIFVFVFWSSDNTPPRSVTISFNANGADEGTVSPITCDAGTQVQLPSGASFVRKGYRFAGWGPMREYSELYSQGELFSTNDNVTLYAHWQPEDSEGPKVLQYDFHVAENGECLAVLSVRNVSSVTQDLIGEFSFTNASGEIVDSRNDQVICIGPGEDTLLVASSKSTDVTEARYSVKSKEPAYGHQSISDCVTVAEVSCNSTGLTVRVENVSIKTVVLWYSTAYGTSSTKEFALVTTPFDDGETLRPGESKTITFEGEQWVDLNHSVYLYGYVK